MPLNIPKLVRDLMSQVVVPLVGHARTPVLHASVIGRNTYGPLYGPQVSRKALVEDSKVLVASQDGSQKLSVAKFTFFEQITINEGDQLTLNGVTTVVVKVGGLLDPNGKPYLPEAWTGKLL